MTTAGKDQWVSTKSTISQLEFIFIFIIFVIHFFFLFGPLFFISLPTPRPYMPVSSSASSRFVLSVKQQFIFSVLFARLLTDFSGVLIRLTTCKILTHSLYLVWNYALSYPPPMKQRDSRSAGYTGGRVNIQAHFFPGDTGEWVFQVRQGEGLKKCILKYIYIMKIKIRTPAVRSNILSNLIFASCVWYSDRAYYGLCVLNKDRGRRLPLQLQCSYHGQQGDVRQSVRGNYKTRFWGGQNLTSVEGNASVYQVNPVSQMTIEGRA